MSKRIAKKMIGRWFSGEYVPEHLLRKAQVRWVRYLSKPLQESDEEYLEQGYLFDILTREE